MGILCKNEIFSKQYVVKNTFIYPIKYIDAIGVKMKMSKLPKHNGNINIGNYTN